MPESAGSVAVASGLFVGFAFGCWSGWVLNMWLSIGRTDKHSEFLSCIKYDSGKVELLKFALSTRLSAKAAKRYLDHKAKEFGGISDINEVGDIIYYFGKSKQQLID
jgi:hypothetical protein